MADEASSAAAIDWWTVLNTTVGIVSLIAGVVSLILGIFAIWLSLYFYNKAKESEVAATNALTAIKTQSDALQRLTGRLLDRFARHATEPRQMDEDMRHLVQALASIPQTLLTTIRIQPEASAANPRLRAEIIMGYIGLFYYSGLSNSLAQALLPSADAYDPAAQPAHAGIRNLVDRSAADCRYIYQCLNGLNAEELRASALFNLLQEANEYFWPSIKTTDEAYAAQRAGSA